MSETKASFRHRIKRFPCPKCGAILKYAPSTTHLVCDYCGFKNCIEYGASVIREYNLQEALQQLLAPCTESSSQQIHCDKCGAEFQFETYIHAGECPFCSSPVIIATPRRGSMQPESILPFRINEAEAHKIFSIWINALYFSPNAIKQYGRSKLKLTGIYLPYWIFNSNTETNYTGERGNIYYTDQPAVQVRHNNQTLPRSEYVQKIRWTPVSGHVHRLFDNVLVSASNSLPCRLLDALQPWDIEKLISYNEKYLSGFHSEFYQVGLDQGFDHAKQFMNSVIHRDIAHDIGGDHQRIYQVRTRHNATTYKHCLLPVWFAAFHYRNKYYQFIINARSGKAQGERPYSWWKIGFTLLTALLVATGVFHYLEAISAF